MHIRLATTADIDEIAGLYKDTIDRINSRDYSKEQIEAWSSTYNNAPGWIRRIEEQRFYVAILDDKIVGFASIDTSGYLDLLYIHKDYQAIGIASKLLNCVEKAAKEMGFAEITVQSSITAKPFFLKKGFVITGEHNKLINGVPFINSMMKKRI